MGHFLGPIALGYLKTKTLPSRFQQGLVKGPLRAQTHKDNRPEVLMGHFLSLSEEGFSKTKSEND